jgi:2-polyprenyl-3-methyl-5-hydroxy-6-metoxy-1,4-benzoquinol methylase
MEAEDFYKKLFLENPKWSNKYPNHDETCRWSKISEFLSLIVTIQIKKFKSNIRILDLGCGRGWLTNLASIYGYVEGVDPIASSIRQAKKNFPAINFYVGTAADLIKLNNFEPYDIIISSEVIEHVIDKINFVNEIVKCLKKDGYVIISTPRGEEYNKWLRMKLEKQPIEKWISEKDLYRIFLRKNFIPIYHDRVYIDKPEMSIIHRISSSKKISKYFDSVQLTWMIKALQYITAVYQVWCFQLKDFEKNCNKQEKK